MTRFRESEKQGVGCFSAMETMETRGNASQAPFSCLETPLPTGPFSMERSMENGLSPWKTSPDLTAPPVFHVPPHGKPRPSEPRSRHEKRRSLGFHGFHGLFAPQGETGAAAVQYQPGLTARQALLQAERALQLPSLSVADCQVLAYQCLAHPDLRRPHDVLHHLAQLLWQLHADPTQRPALEPERIRRHGQALLAVRNALKGDRQP